LKGYKNVAVFAYADRKHSFKTNAEENAHLCDRLNVRSLHFSTKPVHRFFKRICRAWTEREVGRGSTSRDKLAVEAKCDGTLLLLSESDKF
jgi:hypothetical protein